MAVDSFKGRTGAVVPAAGDYDVTLLANTTANRLFGTDGSGNSGLIGLSSGLSLSGSTLSNVWDKAGNDISNNNSGNVGIGTATNGLGSKLDVRGIIGVGSGANDSEVRFRQYNDAAKAAWNISVRNDVGGANNDLKFLRFNSGGGFVDVPLQIAAATGLVGINDTAPVGAQLTVNGASGNGIAYFNYGTAGSPAPINPTFGYVGVGSVVYGDRGTTLVNALNIALAGTSNQVAGNGGIAVGVGAFAECKDAWTPGASWVPGTAAEPGCVALFASGATTVSGTIFGAGIHARATVTSGAIVVGAEIDTAVTTATCDSKTGLNIVSPSDDTGTITRTNIVALSGAAVVAGAAVNIAAIGSAARGFPYGILSVCYAGGPSQPITEALWRSGGWSVPVGLDWHDQVFSTASLMLPGFVVDGNGGTTIGGVYKGPGTNGGVILTEDAGSNLTFNWTGTALQFKIANTTVKTFVIDHPVDHDKYLVHAAIEGPEAAVFYRGTARLEGKTTEISLPSYASALIDEDSATVQVTQISDRQEACLLTTSRVRDGKFTVTAKAVGIEFFWTVMATRKDVSALNVEPLKSSVVVNGDGPYRYLYEHTNGDGKRHNRIPDVDDLRIGPRRVLEDVAS